MGVQKMKQIDVMQIPQFVRGTRRITQAVDIVREGEVIGRMVPVGQLSDAEKQEIVQQGWDVVQEARNRNRDRSEGEIGKIVDAAVKRARSRK